MRVSLRPYRASRGFNLDWMLVTVGLMAVALLTGSLIRVPLGGPDAQFGAYMGGLRALSDTERLLLFEDLSSGTDPAWSGGARQDEQVGLGAVWMAVPPEAALERDIALPDGVKRAFVSFDLIALNDWAGNSIEVALQGRTLLRHGFSEGMGGLRLEDADGMVVRARYSGPRSLGLSPDQPKLTAERLSIEVALEQPDPVLRLTLTPQPGASAQTAPAWAVDNLMIIVEGDQP
jgi:hypothetical protein